MSSSTLEAETTAARFEDFGLSQPTLEALERVDGLPELSPPLERLPTLENERGVQLGLEVARAPGFEIEVPIPGHLRHGPMKEGVRVMEEARPPRVFDRRQPAPCRVEALQADRLEAGTPQVRLQDQAIVPGAQDDDLHTEYSSITDRFPRE